MIHTLVTFLGRVRKLEGGGYETATYRFPNGVDRRSVYFGLALAEHLSPDQVVILGTRGSMWSVLVESLATEDDKEDTRLELLEAEERGQMTEDLLDRMAPTMSQAVNRRVMPRLIPFARDDNEQYDILQDIADAVPDGDVSFDLTHGFRHLGMVGFMSAFMLERVRNLDVRGLWYGALDMKDRSTGTTPVLRLDGLIRVRRWVDALDRFDANGDYGVFAPLLIEDGVPEDKARCLERAAFLERTLNLPDAARQIGTFLPVLDDPLSGASGLFRNRLSERLAWVREIGLAEHQRKLAFEHLERGDFMRAAVFGWEALVTQECDRRGFTSGGYHEGRRPAIEEFEAEINEGDHPDWKRDAFHRLKAIRNALAHGSPPVNRHRKVLKQPELLRTELERAFQQLLNEDQWA